MNKEPDYRFGYSHEDLGKRASTINKKPVSSLTVLVILASCLALLWLLLRGGTIFLGEPPLSDAAYWAQVQREIAQRHQAEQSEIGERHREVLTSAETTYTPQQLNRMVNSGQHPEQGPVTNTETKTLSFPACKVAVKSVISEVGSDYPVRIIVNTNILYMVKTWANNGVVTASCSQPDRKMLLTQSSYR